MHPSDSEDNVDIGLSSEEEAEDLPDDVHIRRKFVPPPVPPQSQPAPSTSTGGSANIQVPVEALQKVQQYIGQLLGGEATPGVFLPPEDPPAPTSEEVPFSCAQAQEGREGVPAVSEEVLGHRDIEEPHATPLWETEACMPQ